MDTRIFKTIFAGFTIGFALVNSSVVMANPGEHCDQKQVSPDKMHEHMKDMLDRLADRLEIKASQQTVWGEFAKSVEMLSERNVKEPSVDADATAISRYRAERATDFAKKLTVIANATARLQKMLTEDQRKIFNQASQRFLHKHHGGNDHGMDHEWHRPDQRENADKENQNDVHDKDTR